MCSNYDNKGCWNSAVYQSSKYNNKSGPTSILLCDQLSTWNPWQHSTVPMEQRTWAASINNRSLESSALIMQGRRESTRIGFHWQTPVKIAENYRPVVPSLILNFVVGSSSHKYTQVQVFTLSLDSDKSSDGYLTLVHLLTRGWHRSCCYPDSLSIAIIPWNVHWGEVSERPSSDY